MRTRRLLTYTITMLSAVALCACGSSAASSSGASSGSSSPYRVLALIALSGPTALDGKAEAVGVKAAVTVVNAHGGILGHPVSLTLMNDNGDPTTALTDVTQAIDGSSPPDLVFAGTDGAETDAVTPLLAQHKILSIQPTIATRSYSPSYAPYNFSDTATATALSTAFAQGAISQSGAKTVGILLPDDALGTLSGAPEEAVLKSAGVKYYVATYPAGGTDFSPELLRLKSDNVQALFATGLGTDAATIMTSRSKIAWNVPLYGDGTVATSNVGALVPAADLTGVQVFAFPVEKYLPPAQRTAAFNTFFSAVQKQNGGPLSLAMYAYSAAYDVLPLAQLAASQAHSIATAAMTSALLSLPAKPKALYVTFPVEQFSSSDHALTLGNNYLFVSPDPAAKDGLFAVPAGVTP
jgi:branched-chain amino acid transport system substrate-binding protein